MKEKKKCAIKKEITGKGAGRLGTFRIFKSRQEQVKKPIKRLIKRLAVTLTAGLTGILLAVTVPEGMRQIAQNRREQTAVTAWWGTLYPKFCFSRFPTENKDKKDDIKISFWLARVIDW